MSDQRPPAPENDHDTGAAGDRVASPFDSPGSDADLPPRPQAAGAEHEVPPPPPSVTGPSDGQPDVVPPPPDADPSDGWSDVLPPPPVTGPSSQDAEPLTAPPPPVPPPPASPDVPLIPPSPPPPQVLVEDEPLQPAGGGSRPPWIPILLVLALVAVAIVAYLLGRGDDDDEVATPSPSTSTTAAAGAAGEFITVKDEQAGFTIQYPKDWKPLRDASGEERLLLSAGGQNYFQLKVRAVDPATVKTEIQQGLAEVKMVTEPKEFTLAGLPTSYYLYYTPVNEQSPNEGVHAHYFVVRGELMYTMVFQALPTAEFTRLAPVFDKVAESFQPIEIAAPPASSPDSTSPTTAAATTTVP